MIVRNTNRRSEVLEIYRWSVAEAELGHVQQLPDWDATSTWHNSLFRDLAAGQQWVVYLPDHAWPGEVRLVSGSAVTSQ
jgi:hypothetical protein